MAKIGSLKKVSDLLSQMYDHPNVGMAGVVTRAVEAVESRGVLPETEISSGVLGVIRQAIYETNDSGSKSQDPIEMLFEAMMSQRAGSGPSAGNPVEEALQYIEGLMRNW